MSKNADWARASALCPPERYGSQDWLDHYESNPDILTKMLGDMYRVYKSEEAKQAGTANPRIAARLLNTLNSAGANAGTGAKTRAIRRNRERIRRRHAFVRSAYLRSADPPATPTFTALRMAKVWPTACGSMARSSPQQAQHPPWSSSNFRNPPASMEYLCSRTAMAKPTRSKSNSLAILCCRL